MQSDCGRRRKNYFLRIDGIFTGCTEIPFFNPGWFGHNTTGESIQAGQDLEYVVGTSQRVVKVPSRTFTAANPFQGRNPLTANPAPRISRCCTPSGCDACSRAVKDCRTIPKIDFDRASTGPHLEAGRLPPPIQTEETAADEPPSSGSSGPRTEPPVRGRNVDDQLIPEGQREVPVNPDFGRSPSTDRRIQARTFSVEKVLS